MYSSAAEKTVMEYTGHTIRDLKQFAEISDLHKSAIDVVSRAARNVTRIEDLLRDEIKTAQRDLDRATEDLDAGYAINENGVLQSTARKVDTLAARRADAYAHLTAVCHTAAALPTPT